MFLTGVRLSNLIPDNVMGLKILKRKCLCGSNFFKIIWKLLSLKVSTIKRLVVRQCFLHRYQRTKGSSEELVEVIVCTLNMFVFSLLYIISCIRYAFYIC